MALAGDCVLICLYSATTNTSSYGGLQTAEVRRGERIVECGLVGVLIGSPTNPHLSSALVAAFSLSPGVAAHTVLEIANLPMPGLNVLRGMVVAAITRVLFEVRRHVTGLAGNVAALAVVERESVIERRALPGVGGMALRTVRAKSAQMLLRVGMTAHARLRRALKDIVDVTLAAQDFEMRARQLKRC